MPRGYDDYDAPGSRAKTPLPCPGTHPRARASRTRTAINAGVIATGSANGSSLGKWTTLPRRDASAMTTACEWQQWHRVSRTRHTYARPSTLILRNPRRVIMPQVTAVDAPRAPA